MKIWIDFSAPAHVLVFRPLIGLMQQAGHDVTVTARDYAGTLDLVELHRVDATSIGEHGGSSRLSKFGSLVSRTKAMRAFARDRAFDLAVAHGSNDLAIAARLLRIPAVNMFDYEFATLQHNIGCRSARRVIVPESIPPERLRRYGVGPAKLKTYPGLKEEYYLADLVPDSTVLADLGIDTEKVLIVLRPPPDIAMYHRANHVFGDVLDRVGRDPGVQTVVLPRTSQQKEQIHSMALASTIVPERAVDAQSLIALCDLVISAGGTMNREAVALGAPVYTTFSGRLGGVDEMLIREGRLRRLDDPAALRLAKREGGKEQVKRDPKLLVEMILGARSEAR